MRWARLRQDVRQFVNAELTAPLKYTKGDGAVISNRRFLVLGPIREFALQDVRSGLARTFDVIEDSAGDFLVLLVPRSPRQKPQKAYLVGGVVREREGDKRVSA